jgi:uncharacterized protein YdaU (DUF1376 family)
VNPPYPADTRAKGWRFELDHERIRQSDTWALAAPEHRPWLLMLWMVAWEQTPCGSLPDDDALITARLDMAPKAYAKARDTLRRGWWLAEDGRLYHHAITQHVLRMIEKRAKEAARKAGNRHATPAPVPRDNTGTDGTSTSNTSTSNTSTKKEIKTPRKRGTPLPVDFDLSERVAEWAGTKGYPPPLVKANFEAFVSYAKRKGATYVDWDEALMTAIREDWAKSRQPEGETAYQRSMRERAAEIHPAIARAAPKTNPMELLDGITARIAR